MANAPKLPKERFYAVVKVLQTHFQHLAEMNGRKLEFYTDYNSDWAQAFARRWDTDQIHVYGGISGMKGSSEDSMALVLCHELGHLYGERPYSDEHNQLSVEGQADYWSTLICFKQIVGKLSEKNPSASALKYCSDEKACARAVDAGLVVTAFYADNRSISHPKIETPDLLRVETTLKTHPAPQCRLDTILAGLMNDSRPQCWFAD